MVADGENAVLGIWGVFSCSTVSGHWDKSSGSSSQIHPWDWNIFLCRHIINSHFSQNTDVFVLYTVCVYALSAVSVPMRQYINHILVLGGDFHSKGRQTERPSLLRPSLN